MPDYSYIYSQQANLYDRLVTYEDYQGNLLRRLNEVVDFRELDVVETGAGTGRITALIAPLARTIQAFDASAHMLAIAEARLKRSGLANWKTGLADHRCLPVPGASADLLVSGWSVCYLAVSDGKEHRDGEQWQVELEKGLNEFRRILRPGGKIILIETLGTGYEEPHRYPNLANYLAYLDASGFQSLCVRTDYRFASLEEERELVSFFFDDPMSDKIKITKQGVILPECTGIWWR